MRNQTFVTIVCGGRWLPLIKMVVFSIYKYKYTHAQDWKDTNLPQSLRHEKPNLHHNCLWWWMVALDQVEGLQYCLLLLCPTAQHPLVWTIWICQIHQIPCWYQSCNIV